MNNCKTVFWIQCPPFVTNTRISFVLVVQFMFLFFYIYVSLSVVLAARLPFLFLNFL